MIKINNEKVSYVPAVLGIMYDNSINPTGLGSVGIFTEVEGVKLYIGLKKDVIDVITNLNTHTFININTNKLKDNKWGTDNYVELVENIVKIQVDKLDIDLDVEALRKSIYELDNKTYFRLVKLRLFKDNYSYGGVMHYYSNLNVEQGLISIGKLVTAKEEMFVFNKNIIDPDVLNDEYRYSIWWLKQNIDINTLSTYSKLRAFEKLNVDDGIEYIKYFNDNHIAATTKTNSKEFDSIKSSKYFNVYNPVEVEDLDGDVWKTNGNTTGNGVYSYELENNTNFGLKEARKAYFDLREGKAFTNVGYEAENRIFGDNFYIDTDSHQKYNYISKIHTPALRIELNNCYSIFNKIGDRLPTEIMHSLIDYSNGEIDFDKLVTPVTTKILKDMICTKQEAKQVAVDVLCKNMKNDSDFTYISDYIKENLYFSASIHYLSVCQDNKTDNLVGKTIFVVNPFYNYYAYYNVTDADGMVKVDSNNNVSFTFPDTGYKFGIDGDKFYWKNIEKEFRLDRTVGIIKNEKVFVDLTKKGEFTAPAFKPSTFVEDVMIWFGNNKPAAGVYIVDSKELSDHMKTFDGVSAVDNLFSSKYGYTQ